MHIYIYMYMYFYIYIYIYGTRYTYNYIYIHIHIILPESGRFLPKLTNSDWRPFWVAPSLIHLKTARPSETPFLRLRLRASRRSWDLMARAKMKWNWTTSTPWATLSMQMGSISIFMGGIKHQFIWVIYLLWDIVSLCIVSSFDGGWGWSWWLCKQSWGKQKERALWPYVSHTVLIIFVPSQKWPCQWTILDDFDENPQQFIWNVPAQRRLIAGLNAFRDFLTGGAENWADGRKRPWQVWGHGIGQHVKRWPCEWWKAMINDKILVYTISRLRTGSRFPKYNMMGMTCWWAASNSCSQ